MLDILIRGGEYPDFEKKKMTAANVGIKDGTISYIGTEEPESRRKIDAAGKVVSPGFIDVHMHEENFSAEGKKFVIAELMLKMGVTTAVGGNCGIQRQPLREFKQVLAELGGSPVNYMIAAGYNRCRYELGIGRYEEATPTQSETMKKMLAQELSEGAAGISFGIEYDPGISREEILAALEVTRRKDLLVSAHYRSSCTKDVSAIREMIDIAREIPMKFQISHISSCSAMGGMKESLALIDEGMDENERLDFDTYPYNAFSTHVGSEVFEDGCLERWRKDYDCIMLTEEPYRNVRCTAEILADARKNYPQMLAVVFAMNEDEIAAAVSFHRGMIASDGIISNGKGHPRAAGTFPRVLGKYVREEKRLTMAEALSKMTAQPAKRLGLNRKGRIEKGFDADITIFDPMTIADRADFTDINKAPSGVETVLIGGRTALEKGKIVSGREGRFIGC